MQPPGHHQSRRASEKIRSQAKILQDKQGIPYPKALQVAAGQRTLSQVLQEMLREESIRQLLARHPIDKSRAILVVDKRRSLDEVLIKLRARQNILSIPGHARLQKLLEDHLPVALQVDPDQIALGQILEIGQYELRLQPPQGEIATLRKLDLHFFFEAKDLAQVQKAIKLDRAVLARNLQPEMSPGKRAHFKHAVFQRLVESQEDCVLTTRRGHALRGKVVRFDLYEVDLKLSKGPLVTCCRHALGAVG